MDTNILGPKQVKIYDVTKKVLIHTATSQEAAAKYLGLTSGRVSSIIKGKMRNNNKKLGITITCR